MTLKTRTLTNAGAPLRSPDGIALAGVRVTFTLSSFGSARDVWDAESLERVAGKPVKVTTDAQGEFTVDLWPNSRGNRSTKYLCHVDHPGVLDFAGAIEDLDTPLSWAAFMAGGTELTPQEISQLAAYIAQIEAARDAAQDAAAQAEGATDAAIATHVADPDPHTQYLLRDDAAAVATSGSYNDLGDKPMLGSAAGQDASAFATAEQGAAADTAVQPGDPRLTDSRTPTGAAGGALAGSYPNPVFAVDMATQAELDAAIAQRIPMTQRGAANGVASLDAGGKVPESQMPAIAITDVFPVASQAAMLALTAERGDVAVRSDINRSFALAAEPASLLANWLELRTPTDAVLSVAGKTGAVTLAKADVGLGNVDNTPDNAKPVSTAQAAAIATATAIHPFLLIGA